MLLGLLIAGFGRAATSIAPGFFLIPGEATPNRQPDGNSVMIEAPDGWIVFDTGRHVEHTAQIIDFAKAQNRPVAAIINSHWHLDHVGGNPQLRALYPSILVYASSAIEGARTGFLADYRAQLEASIARPKIKPEELAALRAEVALIDAGAALDPTDVITRSTAMMIAGRRLQVHLESHAVTQGDVWVYDEKTRVLLAGDLVTLPAPFFESACPARWRDSLQRLQREPFEWLVPGHGAAMQKAGLAAYSKAFSHLLECAAGNATDADCIDGWIGNASSLIESKDVSYARSLIAYYLQNYLRHPSERIKKFCSD